MRKLVCGAQLSLDGVMQAPGAPQEDPTHGFRFGGWSVPYWDDAAMGQFMDTRKYVATSSREPLTWHNSVAIHDAAKDVAKLKQQDGPVLLTQGSAVLLQTLLANDLVDELQLVVFPLVLGKGKRLFGEGASPAALKVVESKVAKNGVIMTRYRRDGAIKTGSFVSDEPGPAELARREKMKRED